MNFTPLFRGHHHRAPQLCDRVGETGSNVLRLEVGKIAKDFFFTDAIRQHLEDIDHANPQTANARTPVALIGADGNSSCQALFHHQH